MSASRDIGEVVHELEILVVDLEWAAGRVAPAAQILAQADVGYAPGIFVRDFEGRTEFGVYIPAARQLLGDVVEQRVIAEAGFVHLVRRKGTDIGEDPLAGPGVEHIAIDQRHAGERRKGGFVVPTVAAEPLRVGSFGEIDAFGEGVSVVRLGRDHW